MASSADLINFYELGLFRVSVHFLPLTDVRTLSFLGGQLEHVLVRNASHTPQSTVATCAPRPHTPSHGGGTLQCLNDHLAKYRGIRVALQEKLGRMDLTTQEFLDTHAELETITEIINVTETQIESLWGNNHSSATLSPQSTGMMIPQHSMYHAGKAQDANTRQVVNASEPNTTSQRTHCAREQVPPAQNNQTSIDQAYQDARVHVSHTLPSTTSSSQASIVVPLGQAACGSSMQHAFTDGVASFGPHANHSTMSHLLATHTYDPTPVGAYQTPTAAHASQRHNRHGHTSDIYNANESCDQTVSRTFMHPGDADYQGSPYTHNHGKSIPITYQAPSVHPFGSNRNRSVRVPMDPSPTNPMPAGSSDCARATTVHENRKEIDELPLRQSIDLLREQVPITM